MVTNPMPPMNIDETLRAALLADDAALWRSGWQAALRSTLATFAAAAIDVDAGTASSALLALEDATGRERIAAADGNIGERVADQLLAHRTAFDTAVVASGYRALSRAQLRRRLVALVPTLTADPASRGAIDASPFPDFWTDVAHALGRQLAADLDAAAAAAPMAEWRLLNRLLLISYFASSRIMFASDARNDLAEKARGPVPVRGPLTRLVQSVGPEGMRDGVPPYLPPSATLPPPLRTAGISALLSATQAERNAAAGAQGLLHRLVGIDHGFIVPPAFPGRPDLARAMDVRRAMYDQYEQTIVTYMTLASIEQLLRAWATRLAVPHLTPAGRPIPAGEWIHRLGASAALRELVDDLYSVDRSNVRNRFLHGGLIDVESTRAQVTLAAYFPARYPAAVVALSPYAPDNVARYCGRCLALLDQEAMGAGVGPADVLWTDRVFLTPDEVLLGHQLSADFYGPNGVAIADQIGGLLSSATPALGQFARVGLLGWYEANPADPLPRFMTLLVIFEALYRVVAHLHGIDVLQRDDANKRYQYKMLDGTGLCAPAIVDRLTAFLPGPSRETAARVLMLTVKARNALAHGAVREFTADTMDGAGHLAAKSMHLLVASALYHMTREAAYYRYLNRKPGEANDPAADWRSGQRDVLASIKPHTHSDGLTKPSGT